LVGEELKGREAEEDDDDTNVSLSGKYIVRKCTFYR
jgi:hypothetical protein